MEDNVWEYPFGDLEDDDDDMFFRTCDGLNLKRQTSNAFIRSQILDH
jgi:hypothetical protein